MRRRAASLSTARAGAAVALGVTALGLAMALMTGYREDLAERLVGGGAPILVYSAGDSVTAEELVRVERLLRTEPGVTEVAPVAFREAVLAAGEREPSLVRGSEPGAGPFAVPHRPWRRAATAPARCWA
jgi:ABC-type lipoprotein release transport system permease subunit